MDLEIKQSETLPEISNYNIKEINCLYKPQDIFESFIDESILEMIRVYSYNYMHYITKVNHKEFSRDEIKNFLIINIFFP
jgi:hypothetical protein